MARTKHKQRKNANFKRSLQPNPLNAVEVNTTTLSLPIRARSIAPDMRPPATPPSLSPASAASTSISPLALAAPPSTAPTAWVPLTDVEDLDWSTARTRLVHKSQRRVVGMETMMCISFKEERPKYLPLKYQDHPDLPANAPLNHAHLLDMSDFCEKTVAVRLCLVDAVATLLFHWDPSSIKNFFDVDSLKKHELFTMPNTSNLDMRTAVSRRGRRAVVGLYRRVSRKTLLWDCQVRFHIAESGEWLPKRGFVNGVTHGFEHDPREAPGSSTFAAISNEHEIRQMAKQIAVYILVNKSWENAGVGETTE